MTVSDRWHKARPQPDEEKCRQHNMVPAADHGQGDRWQVRWRDERGRQKKAFARKSDADGYDAKVKTQLADGTYIDESAGQVSFRAYAEDWRVNRMHDPATAERIEGMLRNHVYSSDEMPGRTRGGGMAIGDYPLRVLAKRVTIIQGWIKGLNLGPNSALLVIGYVSQVFTAAVEEGMITRNPLTAKSVQKPDPVKTEVIPWTAGEIDTVAHELPGRLAVAPYIGASFGTRQGELFGLAKADLDFLRKTGRVAVQIKAVGGQLVFAPVKNKKARDVPTADPVIPRLSEYMRRFPPVPVTLSWHEPGNKKRHGKPVTRELILTRPDGRPADAG